MKQLFYFLISILLLNACKKINPLYEEPLIIKTELAIKVIDSYGQNVNGATVILLICGYPALSPKITDSYGVVLFDSIPYSGLCDISIYVYKDAASNRNHLSSIPIIPHQKNQYQFIINETGILKMQIDPCSMFNISCNVYTGDISGCSTYYFFPDTGPFSFRSALATNPNIYKDTIVQIRLRDTTNLVLPY